MRKVQSVVAVVVFALVVSIGAFAADVRVLGASAPATMSTPAPGSKLGSATVTFTWTTGTGVTAYSLSVGTTAGAHDIDYFYAGSSLSHQFTNLPTNGGTIYVTLNSLIGGTWQSKRYTYIASGVGTPATMTSPAAKSKLTGTSETFMWTTGSGVSIYSLYIGTTHGAHDIAYINAGSATSYLVNNLPNNGETIYVTLNSLIGGVWHANAYTYSAHGSGTAAVITSPANDSTLTGATVTFQWTAGTAISGYTLYIGTSVGAHDIDFINAGTALSYQVTNLPTNAHTIYVTLYSLNGSTYLSHSYTYTASATSGPSRVVWIPDFYGGALNVVVGTGGSAKTVTVNLPNCNPNAVAVNADLAYVACNAFGANTDAILVYDAATIRAAAAGVLVISPSKTITSAQFNSLIGLAFDVSSNLWIASYGNNQIDEITAAQLATATPIATAELSDSPDSPVALQFDGAGGLWVSGQYQGGIVLHFPSNQIHQGFNATPDYCLATTDLGAGCQFVNGVFLNPEGLALFGGDVWVSNNATGVDGATPGREIVDLKFSGGSITVNAIFGNSADSSKSPFVCPGGLFGGNVHLWVNDESYGEATPQCGAAGDVASSTGGVFDFTQAQLTAQTTTVSQVLAYSNLTGRPGFGGIFVENDQ